MIKVSSNQVKTVLAEASASIKELVSDYTALSEKLASYEKKERCEKIAQEMQVKGIYPELNSQEKLAYLVEKDNDQLTNIEGALEFQPKLSKIASLDEKIANTMDPLRKLYESLDL